MEGWVAHMDQCRIYGSWSQQEQSLHINILKMRAIGYAFRQFNIPTDCVILVSSDNSTVVAYVSKQGRTSSVLPMEETYLLFHLLQSREMEQSKVSPWAQECDSRVPVQTKPNPSIRMVSPPFHHPENTENLELSNGGFVCHQREQKKLPLQAWAEDAVLIDLTGLQACACPPTSIMFNVL